MHGHIIGLPLVGPEDVRVRERRQEHFHTNEKILERQRRASIRQIRTTPKNVEPNS